MQPAKSVKPAVNHLRLASPAMDRGNPGAGAYRWLDVLAAAIPATASAFAVMRLAPLAGHPALPIAIVLVPATFVLAFAVMRRTDPPVAFALPAFEAPAAQSELLLDQLWAEAGELVLDNPLPLPLEDVADELLLDDPLGVPDDSRVVRLFDPRRFPDPGELNDRIARHLARGGPAAPAGVDASDELRQALAELRSALRPAGH
jgi:hypothetical protein